MQRLEVSSAVQLIYGSLGVKGLIKSLEHCSCSIFGGLGIQRTVRTSENNDIQDATEIVN